MFGRSVNVSASRLDAMRTSLPRARALSERLYPTLGRNEHLYPTLGRSANVSAPHWGVPLAAPPHLGALCGQSYPSLGRSAGEAGSHTMVVFGCDLETSLGHDALALGVTMRGG